ncbi:4'-phosphopantetheinyl transferase family protein [Priestia aryabhattai]|uniref:4'-phosphopantetheinyl transferase family protein n=1 Tax=Priestia megaterium TaxID=1404 RepID=UPI0039B893E2
MIEVYALQVPDNIQPQIYSRLLSSVSLTKQERIKRFKRKEDIYRTLIADILIRSIISAKCGMPNEDITFTYNSYGKPFLLRDNNFSFNVSHSGRWVVAIIGEQELIGIDVEEIRPIDIDIARRFFAPEEYIALKEKEEREYLSYFYDLWTLKESYIKAIGRGMSIPLDSFVIKRKSFSREFSISQKDSLYSFFFRQYAIDTKYKISACATSNNFPESITIYDFYELYNRFFSNKKGC